MSHYGGLDISLKTVFICLIVGLTCVLCVSIISCAHVFYLIKNKKYSPKILLKDFDQKIWMTLGLGVPFFSFYFFGIHFLSKWVDPSTGLELFFLAYRQPVLFIYFGLFVFAFFTLTIYFVRILIKYFYLTRR